MELFCSLCDDKYARDAGHWRSRATIAYEAAPLPKAVAFAH